MMKSVAAVAVLVGGLVAANEGYGGVMVAALVVAALLTAGSRMVLARGHSHAGDKPRSARHEAGHAAAARALGGRVVSATLNPDGSGYVDAYIGKDSPRDQIAFLRAGQYAAGTSRGAEHDERDVRRVLRGVPAAERAKVLRGGEADARRIVASRSGEIRRDARRLMDRGVL